MTPDTYRTPGVEDPDTGEEVTAPTVPTEPLALPPAEDTPEDAPKRARKDSSDH
jgi:hypothetical protein